MLYVDCLLGDLIKSGDESSVWNMKFGLCIWPQYFTLSYKFQPCFKAFDW